MKPAFKQVVCQESQQEVGTVKVAQNFFSRLRGLSFYDPLPWGLYLPGCHAIHMFGMKHALDLVFVDRDLKIIKIQTCRPWQAAVCFDAFGVFEFPSGQARELNLGQHLNLKGSSD